MKPAKTPKHDVYRNLHTDTWSVLDRQEGRVSDHPTDAVIMDARLIVQPAGNAKVRKTKKKFVHAYVRGWRGSMDELQALQLLKGLDKGVRITYNPYQHTTFVIAETNAPIKTADWVYLASDKTVWAFNPR